MLAKPFASVVGMIVGMVLLTLIVLNVYHSPQPHNLPVAIVGTGPVVDGLVQKLDASPQLAVRRVDNGPAARTLIEDRKIYGAFAPLKKTGVVLVASAASQPVAGILPQIFAPVGQQLGLTPSVKDIAPLPSSDSAGASGYFLALVALIFSGLAGWFLESKLPSIRLGWKATLVRIFVIAVGAILAGLAMAGYADYLGIFKNHMLDTALALALTTFARDDDRQHLHQRAGRTGRPWSRAQRVRADRRAGRVRRILGAAVPTGGLARDRGSAAAALDRRADQEQRVLRRSGDDDAADRARYVLGPRRADDVTAQPVPPTLPVAAGRIEASALGTTDCRTGARLASVPMARPASPAAGVHPSRRGGVGGGAEQPGDRVATEVEDRLQVAAHERHAPARRAATAPAGSGRCRASACRRRPPARTRACGARRRRARGAGCRRSAAAGSTRGSRSASSGAGRGGAGGSRCASPAAISIGRRVTTSKRSNGGVSASRLKASAKNAKTSAGGRSMRCSRAHDVDAHRLSSTVNRVTLVLRMKPA